MVSRTVTVGLSITSLLSLLSNTAFYSSSHPVHDSREFHNAGETGAVAGRFVSVAAKIYREAFKAPIKLGQCPLVMQEGSIKTCKDEFEGEEMYLAKGSTTVDVKRVQTSEDILLHIMGGVGASVGVLGLVSINPKVSVATTTETGRNFLNLLNSYEMNKGIVTLHDPRPKHVDGDKALFLSEVELGGNELFLVTLEFESEKQKVDVQLSVTFKILFISVTAKLNYLHETFDGKVGCRIQFKSSWRKELDEYYSTLMHCIPKVKEIEEMYMQGPKELRAMGHDDERSHHIYYFSSWKESPYGKQFNLALINHDLKFLTEQNTEIKAVIQRINHLKDQVWSNEVKKKVIQLNETLTDMTKKLTVGLEKYHTLQSSERDQLRNVYGQQKAPLYYRRYLEKIVS